MNLGAVKSLRLFGKSPSLKEEIMEESKHHMGVSKNMGKPPNNPFVHRVFHEKKTSILGAHLYFWKHPYLNVLFQHHDKHKHRFVAVFEYNPKHVYHNENYIMITY